MEGVQVYDMNTFYINQYLREVVVPVLTMIKDKIDGITDMLSVISVHSGHIAITAMAILLTIYGFKFLRIRGRTL